MTCLEGISRGKGDLRIASRDGKGKEGRSTSLNGRTSNVGETPKVRERSPPKVAYS